MDIQFKPEETERYIRIPTGIRCTVTATITISAERGIKALYCGKEKKIRTYLFDKRKGWTMESAKRWVEEHGKGVGVRKMLHTKAFVEKIGEKEGVLESAVITSEVLDREGEVLKADGGIFDNFLKNPVLLWAHNIREMRPPIGKVLKIWREGKQWKFTPEFDLEDSFAADIYRKFKEGFLNAFSIGFLPLEQDGNTYEKWEALEFSAVPVPANAEALVHLRAKGFETADWEELVEKGVIRFRKTPKAPENTPWNGPKEVAAADVKDLKVMCAWFDSSKPDLKTSYKLPHHKASGAHPVVWRGVRAAMGALMGARGGVRIPSGDRRGVYNHLKKHYAQFGKEAPDFRYVEDQILAKLAPEIEATLEEDFLERKFEELKKEIRKVRPRRRRVEDDTSVGNLKTLALLLNKATEKLLRELKHERR